jgi:hypothetical protein
MKALQIIFTSVLAAICYGIVHDQITIRVSLAYFTVGHPLLFPTQSPTLIALGWGIIATWWIGLPLGILLAIAARWGNGPKLALPQLLKPIGILFGSTAFVAFGAGLIGYICAYLGIVWLVPALATRVPGNQHVGFLAALWSHTASYVGGAVGSLIVIGWVWHQRKQLATKAWVSASHVSVAD